MATAICIRLQDQEGKLYRWTIQHDARPPATWNFKDHEGYTRTVQGNWFDLVSRFKGTADNYGFTLTSDLS